MRIQYTNYPNSKKLTNKSKRVATLTPPLYGIILGAIVGALPGILIVSVFPDADIVPMIFMVAGIVAGPILLSKYRKKKFAQYDAEYDEILRNNKQ